MCFIGVKLCTPTSLLFFVRGGGDAADLCFHFITYIKVMKRQFLKSERGGGGGGGGIFTCTIFLDDYLLPFFLLFSNNNKMFLDGYLLHNVLG
jgi:hypothetical protein